MIPRYQKYLVCTILLFWSIGTLAQNKQANNWYFGKYAGITFNTADGSPEAVYDGMINQNEGCASISDAEGDLLFYTDGIRIWNKLHQIMPNGNFLNGHPSASMSGIIVPWPGHDEEYFVFTVPEFDDPTGLCYSIVNMSLDNGNGDVTEVKNEYLAGPVHEMVTAVLHENGTSVWVISHLWESNTFVSFLIDEDSLHTIPVICNAGMIHGGNNVTTGCMKTSMQGDKLAISQTDQDVYQLFDFDNATAQMSNPITFARYGTIDAYGVEFSPDGSKLYLSTKSWWPNNLNRLVQYELSTGDSAQIASSGIEISGLGINSNKIGTIQLGPDGKIYVTRYGYRFLSIIENPNESGLACNFVANGIELSTDGSRASYYGLPAFIQSFFNPANFTWEGICFSDTTFFAITDTTAQDSVRWDFDDPATGSFNSSTSCFPYHLFSDTGTFQVSVIGFNNNLSDTTVQEVTIYPIPIPVLPSDTAYCEDYGVTLSPGIFNTYFWHDGTNASSYFADNPGLVYVRVSNAHGCKATDSTNVTELSKPDPVVIYHE